MQLALAECETLKQQGNTLKLRNFGLAYAGDLRIDTSEGLAELFNRVCIVSDEGWHIQAERVYVSNFQKVPDITAEDIDFLWGDWQIEALNMTLVPRQEAVFYKAIIKSEQVQADAAEVRYDTIQNTMTLYEANAATESYRVSGKLARVVGDSIFFEDAVATTCLCTGPKLYVINASRVSYDVYQQNITIHNGRLVSVGGITIALAPELVLSEESFKDLDFPFTIAYSADNSNSSDLEGKGWKILVPVPIDDEGSFDIGIQGLDGIHPTTLVALLHIKTQNPNLRASIGVPGEGFQADAVFRYDVTPHMTVDTGMNHRHWKDADYLHEAFLGVTGQYHTQISPGETFRLQARPFAAFSTQTVSHAFVSSLRLGASADAVYTSPVTPLGRFNLALHGEATYYPAYDQNTETPWQYGVRFAPSWSFSDGPLQTSISYRRQWTNGASPFSTTLDRLEEFHTLNVQASYEAVLSDQASLTFTVRNTYDFTQDPDVSGSPLRHLYFSVRPMIDVTGGTVALLAELELADLISPVEDADLKAFAGFGADIDVDEWEVGMLLRFNLESSTLWENLELHAGVPLTFGEVMVKLFLGLDFSPVTVGEPLQISGHGLEVRWDGCCGTVSAFYRYHNKKATTGLSIVF